ncbi:MAG TPA: alkaline phosphatase family protein [Bryobacteraceae bacterium]
MENGVTGGYTDAMGTPSKSLLNEIEFVDKQIGRMINGLKENGLYESTLVVITAKHGQSPIWNLPLPSWVIKSPPQARMIFR